MRTLEIPLDGITLAAMSQGDSGPRVLALHGWLDNAHSFRPLAGHLHDLELVCLDLPGHGLSGHRPPGARYAFVDYVLDILAVADALDWDRFHLLGHSLGGAVATLAAAAEPERIASLALIEGLGPLTTPANQTAATLQKARKGETRRRRRVHPDLETAARARADNSDLEMNAARLLAERGLKQVDGGWQWRHDPRLRQPSPQRFTESQVVDLIAAITAPVLAIRATPASAVISHDHLATRLAALGNNRLLDCPGGHHLHMHHPARIAPAIREHFHDHA